MKINVDGTQDYRSFPIPRETVQSLSLYFDEIKQKHTCKFACEFVSLTLMKIHSSNKS